MAQTATARKPASSSRRARARSGRSRPLPRPRATPAPIPARLVPAAVGRTAVAVGGIADSGFVLRLTRGQLWIAALATLLVGIVALNVGALQLSASSSKAAGQTDVLKRENSALRAELATEVSSERMQRTAAKLGLIVPEPGSIRYLRPSPDDAALAAKRLRDGELAGAEAPVVAVDPATTVEPIVGAAPPAPEPAPAETPATDPAALDPATAPATADAGGVASP